MKNISPEMKSFLTELGALLKKHDVEINIIEECRNYELYVKGIEFWANQQYNATGTTRKSSEVLFEGKDVLFADIERLLDNNKGLI